MEVVLYFLFYFSVLLKGQPDAIVFLKNTEESTEIKKNRTVPNFEAIRIYNDTRL